MDKNVHMRVRGHFSITTAPFFCESNLRDLLLRYMEWAHTHRVSHFDVPLQFYVEVETIHITKQTE